ncbi:alternative ribosome rescue aminoacyl-tRNA hydrolase ArfB [Acidocella aminolytica]|jgi:ribosome-associated protein|uniref:Translation peptide chain release factor Class I/peptidyl-tRNA hydrolase n=1 Tax=Acidocella aminolytica 101 = DSM 11237 TaxID=1120923 RepID=A0A0D6PI09_9PROT|nr:alternative ribosome rescue aminoacyl-tRNA hydrolase ArfB [Acidocella aminolytica]GAN80464.1 translation peptide chain release factor Class I/peptidyl-tRNA hydrolase [Acidocella aminolytica 101 = DSM 11237]GBQ35856.1 peptidyl-tRNA hydrolase domain protein [Acidocella aminolytica 101 = DSM 11237]SHE95951.1 ribosome-associated protein [Acidocella aminolytica 101 = DSM 11237]
MLIRISRNLQISDADLEEFFTPASGPGGQNVNKVSTAVQLRFNLADNTTLPDTVKARLARLAGKRLTQAGILLIESEEHRSQLRNREDAREKLFALIREAAVVPKARRATKPTRASQKRRLDEKSHRGDIKRQRRDRDF